MNERRLTEEQIKQANSVSIVEYARQSGMILKEVTPGYFKIPEMGGLYIDEKKNLWNHFTEDRGGGPIQFVMHMEGKTWLESVRKLIRLEQGENKILLYKYPDISIVEEKSALILPEKNKTFKHIFAYLIGYRKIDKEVVYQMVKEGNLYENTHRACVFVGRDQEGQPRYAFVRSTNTSGQSFKGDVKGSDKSYGFHIAGTSNIVRVFESPIDVLSFATLMKSGRKSNLPQSHLLSLGGLSDKALERYLKEHSRIDRISFCLDNDGPGYQAANHLMKKYKRDYKIDIFYPKRKDWNEDLQYEVYKKEFELREHEEEAELG